MITKEEFIKNTTEDEVFSLIHEFLWIYRAKYEKILLERTLKKKDVIIFDKEVIETIREIIKSIKNLNLQK